MRAHLSDAELLARLVAFDTTSRNSNLPLADFLCDYLDRPGVRIARNPSPDGAKTNVIAWLGPEPRRATAAGLVLSGHMDVVPADEEGWRSDPFTLADEGDRWVARGSCDMKGFLALAAEPRRRGRPDRLRAPLALVFTYDEEVGTLGAQRLTESFPDGGAPAAERDHRRAHLAARGARPQGAPQDADHPPRRSAHSGYPHLGMNAIEPAGRVIVALAALRRELEAEPPPNRELFPEVPYVPLNVGTVHGGSAINVVPDRCVVEVGVRPLPGVDLGGAGRAGEPRRPRRRGRAFEPAIELLSDSPPMLLDEASPIHRHLCALVGQSAGASVSFATDAGWLQRLGMDCAIFGPGSIEVAHKPNELLPKGEFAAARGLLERTVRHFCAGGEHDRSNPRSRSDLDRRPASSPASRSPSATTAASRRSAALGRAPDPRLTGRALLPGIVSAHSHAFQRGLRGRGETFPAGAGSFWTWREAMYALVGRLDAGRVSGALPPDLPRDAGGRHHHRRRVPLLPPSRSGRRTTAPSTRSCSPPRAEAGIRVACIQSYYQTGAIGQPLEGAQRRFSTPVSRGLLGADGPPGRASRSRARRAWPPRSTACAPAASRTCAAIYDEARRRDLPFHIHVEEQREGDRGGRSPTTAGGRWRCSWRPSGRRPTDRRPLHPHRRRGDGPLPRRGRHRLPLPADRGEPGRRHRRPSRARIPEAAPSASGATPTPASPPSRRCAGWSTSSASPPRAAASCGTAKATSPRVLLEAATAGGAQALGVEAGRIEPGLWADFAAIDLDSPLARRLGRRRRCSNRWSSAPPRRWWRRRAWAGSGWNTEAEASDSSARRGG